VICRPKGLCPRKKVEKVGRCGVKIYKLGGLAGPGADPTVVVHGRRLSM
jgi:hypothetical protein